MIKDNFNISNNIQKKYLNKNLAQKFLKKFENIASDINFKINSKSEIYNILSKKFKFNFTKRDLKKFQKFRSIAIIGMGGSILGTEAIYEFLKFKIKKEVFFFNDMNLEKINAFKKKVKFNTTLFLVVSKSGNTVETISNLLILNIIKKNSKNLIIISEKNHNFLFRLAKKYNLFYIEHKKYVGGRYSVLSEVGLVPAFLIGVNITNIRKRTQNYLKKNKNILKRSTTELSTLLYKKKFLNLIFINYVPNLEKFLFWSQQLIAESLGKKGTGFFPSISNCPKDHHSLLQLYLDGPRDKVFNIFSFKEKTNVKLNIKKYGDSLKFLHNKSLSKIKIAQKNALLRSFKKNGVPFREFKINNVNEETLGELFSHFILETVIIAKLLDINPFDQPAVEQVKNFTKQLLK